MKNMQYFDQLQNVMIRSSQLVMQKFRGDYKVFEKNGFSLVTTIDIENEKFLRQELSKIVPQAGFIAEESDNLESGFDLMWVVDPLDGTRNFVKGIPHFCIMVALTYKDEPIVSAIYQPVTKEFYYAEKGKGLWLNGVQEIKFANRVIEHKSAMIVCSQVDAKQIKMKLKENNIQISRRYFGSAGIDAIYLATGAIDLLIFRNIPWWDIAAGMLLIQESGGLICQYDKSNDKNSYGTLKAGNSLFLS